MADCCLLQAIRSYAMGQAGGQGDMAPAGLEQVGRVQPDAMAFPWEMTLPSPRGTTVSRGALRNFSPCFPWKGFPLNMAMPFRSVLRHLYASATSEWLPLLRTRCLTAL